MVASPEIAQSYLIEYINGMRVLRLKTWKAKGVGYIKRAAAEFAMPFCMWRALSLSRIDQEAWDAVVWYSPTIFLGPFVRSIKKKNKCPSYLIVRDIFPEWARDMGLIRRGLPYWVFKGVAAYQYSVADTIGIQTQGNSIYFSRWLNSSGRRLEVLQNWLEPCEPQGCPINLAQTKLAGRQVFVYAGNMGVAQGMDLVLELAKKFESNSRVGFVMVGRGSDALRLKDLAHKLSLGNILFFDEIDPDEIPSLYEQCAIGLVVLDPRHRSHNIPGKFLTYMQSGLPVLAAVNSDNDLIELIHQERVGLACASKNLEELFLAADKLLKELEVDRGYSIRCKSLSERLFSVQTAARQIVHALARSAR
jgi:glycosyltransferase involved in cell wall biosynthesis